MARGRSRPPSDGPGSATGKLDRSTKLLAVVVVLGSVMTILDSTIVNIAIDTLSRELHTPLSTVQWVNTGYLLSLSMAIPLTGWAVDRFGGRRVFLVSVAAFAATSLLCGLAWSVNILIVLRILQGIAGGMTAPVGHALLAQAAGPGKVGRVLGVLGISTTLAPIAGPVVGGLILSYASWRWIFFINVPIGLAAIVLGLRFLPPTAPLRKRSRLDVRGLLLLTPGVGAVVYGLSLAASPNFGGTRALVAVVGGLGLVAAFIVHASIKGPTALLDLGLFGDKVFRAAIVTTFIVGLSIYAFGLLVPLYFQLVRGDGAFLAGIMLVPQSLGGTSVMWASALTDRMGSGRVVLIGIAIMILGAFAFTLVGVHTVYILIALALAIRGFGVGSTVVPTMAGAYVDLGPEQLPRASSTILLVQRLGGSIGTALTAAALQREITSRVTLPSSREPVLSQLAQAGHALPGLTGAFSAVFWMITGVTALAWLPALGLPRRRGAAVSGPRTESS